MTLSQQAAAGPTVRPRAVWYLVVVVLWVASAVLLGTIVASFVRVIDHGVTPISQGIPVSDSGITVYSRTDPVTHDCVMLNPARRYTMDGLSYDLSATFDGTTVYAVASSPDGATPGTYLVRCQGEKSQLYYGDKFPLSSILIRFGISAVLGVLGLVALIVLLVKRHTSKSRIRAEQLAMAPGYGAGWPPGWTGGPPASPYGQPTPPQSYASPPPPQQYAPPPPPQQYPPYEGQQPPPPYDDGTPQH